jgi:hypothetical protein
MSSSLALVLILAVSETEQTTLSELDAQGERQHRFSITLSVPRLVFFTGELSGELRLGDKLGVSLVLGAGAPARLLALELGGQVRYYLLGSFIHGLEVGAQLMGSGLFGRGPAGFEVGMSPFVGYKIAFNIGFTVEAQLGPTLSVFTTAGDATTRIGALINLNVGWSH